MVEIYQDTKAIVTAKIPEIRHVDLFRNQFTQIESGNNQMKAFPFPCLFISFENGVVYEKQSNGLSEGRINMKLYIGFEKLTEAFQEISLLANKIISNVNGLSGAGFGAFSIKSQSYDINHSNLYVWTCEFEASYQSDFGSIGFGELLVVPITPIGSYDYV